MQCSKVLRVVQCRSISRIARPICRVPYAGYEVLFFNPFVDPTFRPRWGKACFDRNNMSLALWKPFL